MTIECEMSGGDEKSCLHCQSMVVNQRAVVFRIVSTNHEFSMNSVVANQKAGCAQFFMVTNENAFNGTKCIVF